MFKSKTILTLLFAISFYQISIGQAFDVVWTNESGVTVNGNSLTKTESLGWGNSGAASENTLASGIDGWAEMTIAETNTAYIFGLSASNANNSYFTVAYGFLASSGNLYVYENGNNRGWISNYNSGDKLRIQRSGTTITYKLNGTDVYTSGIASSGQLLVDVALYSTGATINNAIASFCVAQVPGTSCDDGDANTTGDVIQADGCTCAGTPIGGGSSVFIDDDMSGDGAVRYSGGKVIIGTVGTNKPGNYNLYVEGGIMTELAKVAVRNSASWADYVFENDYNLYSLSEVESFIKTNKHLPNVPSAKEVAAEGIDVAKMDATLLRQIEELWLHMIELKKENEKLKSALEALQN